jgi:hypothetical protein
MASGAVLLAPIRDFNVLARPAAQAAIEPRPRPLATVYVLIMAVAGRVPIHVVARPAAALGQST